MLKKGFTRLTNEALAHLASATIKLVTDTEKKKLPKMICPRHFRGLQTVQPVLNKATYRGMGAQIADIVLQ